MIHATVIGNLGRDAELRVVGSGKSVCNFSVAAKGRDKAAPATWVRAALWGARGEKVAQYLTKGTRVAVSGTLSTRERDGKTYVELDVAELELLGDKQAREESPPPKRQAAQASFAADDEEIPF
jgi:single-strand DNA-binding protein